MNKSKSLIVIIIILIITAEKVLAPPGTTPLINSSLGNAYLTINSVTTHVQYKYVDGLVGNAVQHTATLSVPAAAKSLMNTFSDVLNKGRSGPQMNTVIMDVITRNPSEERRYNKFTPQEIVFPALAAGKRLSYYYTVNLVAEELIETTKGSSVLLPRPAVLSHSLVGKLELIMGSMTLRLVDTISAISYKRIKSVSTGLMIDSISEFFVETNTSESGPMNDWFLSPNRSNSLKNGKINVYFDLSTNKIVSLDLRDVEIISFEPGRTTPAGAKTSAVTRSRIGFRVHSRPALSDLGPPLIITFN